LPITNSEIIRNIERLLLELDGFEHVIIANAANVAKKCFFLPKAAPSGELGLLDTVNVFYAFGEEYRPPPCNC